MEAQRFIATLKRWWFLLVLGAAIAGGVAYVATLRTPPLYESVATLMVGRVLEEKNPDPNSLTLVERLQSTYVQMARRGVILRGAMQRLNLQGSPEALAQRVLANVVVGTQLIEVRAADPDPERAARIANAVAEELVAQSPSQPDPAEERQQQFAQQQLDELQRRLTEGKQQLTDLQAALASSASAAEIKELKTRITTLEGQIATWESNYTALYTTLRPGTTNYLRIVEPATPSAAPVVPRLREILAVAILAGLALGAGVALLLDLLDDSLKLAGEVEGVLGVPTLGIVPRRPRWPGLLRRRGAAPAIGPRDDLEAEAYRTIRANLAVAPAGAPSVVYLICSANRGEGKSTAVVNLAALLALAGRQTVAIDADLRRPSLHLQFGLASSRGLSQLLAEPGVAATAYLQATRLPGLRVLCAGAPAAHPAELLASTRMREVLRELRASAEVILIDSPPLMANGDALVLAPLADQVVPVVEAGRTRRSAAQRMVVALRRVRAQITGVIVNKAPKGSHPQTLTYV